MGLTTRQSGAQLTFLSYPSPHKWDIEPLVPVFRSFRNGALVVARSLGVWSASEGRAPQLAISRTGTFVIFC